MGEVRKLFDKSIYDKADKAAKDAAFKFISTMNYTTVDTTVGNHQIVVYANDTAGNMGKSNTVYLSIIQVIPSSTTQTVSGLNSWILMFSLVLLIMKKRNNHD